MSVCCKLHEQSSCCKLHSLCRTVVLATLFCSESVIFLSELDLSIHLQWLCVIMSAVYKSSQVQSAQLWQSHILWSLWIFVVWTHSPRTEMCKYGKIMAFTVCLSWETLNGWGLLRVFIVPVSWSVWVYDITWIYSPQQKMNCKLV